MPPTKVTCPECETVLKLANPPAPGKKLKCPKCATVFAPPKQKDKPAAPVKKVDKTKPDGGKAKKELPARKKSILDDDGPATYAVFQEEEKEVEDEDDDEEDNRKINYAPDMSIKDLRGPAQEAVVKPSNALIANGMVGFVGWLGILVIIMLPILFPLQQETTENKSNPFGNPAQATKKETPAEPYSKIGGVDLGQLSATILSLIIALLVVFIGLAYAALIVIGGVKMQNLESRGWGIAAAIMTMIPIHTFGLIMLVAVLINATLGMILDDAESRNFYVGVIGLGSWGSFVGTGIWVLRVLFNPKVKAGFEYKPD